MGKNPKQLVEEEVELLRKKVAELKKEVGPKVEKGKEVFQKGEKEVEDYIKANPMKSVALAFTLGLLIGKMTK